MNAQFIKRIVVCAASAILLICLVAVGFVYLAPEAATRAFISFERSRGGLVRKEIDLADGTRYVYLEGGQGEPLLMLHGFGANKDSFGRVAAYLTPKYRVIVPDHIGFGESSHPADADYSPAAQASRIHEFTRALGLQKVDLCGSSMGGQIALAYAALYQAEVNSLWLLAPAGIWSAAPSELRKTFEKTGENPLLVRNTDDLARLLDMVMNEPPFIPRPIVNVLAQERIQNYELEKRIFDQIFNDSVEERVRGLRMPSLIVWGDRDRLLDVSSAKILNSLLPNSQVVIMPNIGHAPMIERPQQSAEDYLRFRASLLATPAS